MDPTPRMMAQYGKGEEGIIEAAAVEHLVLLEGWSNNDARPRGEEFSLPCTVFLFCTPATVRAGSEVPKSSPEDVLIGRIFP